MIVKCWYDFTQRSRAFQLSSADKVFQSGPHKCNILLNYIDSPTPYVYAKFFFAVVYVSFETNNANNNKFTLTLPMLRLFRPHRDTKIFENHLNPVMLVFIG